MEPLVYKVFVPSIISITLTGVSWDKILECALKKLAEPLDPHDIEETEIVSRPKFNLSGK